MAIIINRHHLADCAATPQRLRSDYGKVILPFTVLRRLDCIAPTKQAVLTAVPEVSAKNTDYLLNKAYSVS